MTRLEIIESFNEETKAKFIENCNGLNQFATYERWLNKKLDFNSSKGINGAFGWGNSPEGYDFWDNIAKQILKK